MRTLEQALAALQSLAVRQEMRRVPLSAALGQVLAEEVAAASDQPPFDRTTMDGFAVALDGDRTTFDVLTTVLAGETYPGPLAPGQAVRIMTGAPCPAGATVVPIERTDGGPSGAQGTVSIEPEALLPGKNIAWRGQDAKAGEAILQAGVRLAPQTLSSAAMAGRSNLWIYAPPRVSIVTTGDEVGARGPASVRNSNGPLLAAFCASLGVPYQTWHALDEPNELRETLRAAARSSDIVVTVGGVSMGTADLVPGSAQSLGFERVLHKVAIQPGKPVVCYCGSGVTAAHNILAIRIAGLNKPKLYPGSWSEWITDKGRPVEQD